MATTRFNPGWQMSGTYMHYWSDEPSNAYYADLLGGSGPEDDPVFGTGTTLLLRNVHVVAINSTHIPSDTSALTLRYGYTYFDDSYASPEWTVDDARAMGWEGPWLDQLDITKFPYVYTNDWGAGGTTHGGWDNDLQEWWSQEVSGTYSKFVGAHTVKFGAQWRRIGGDSFLPRQLLLVHVLSRLHQWSGPPQSHTGHRQRYGKHAPGDPERRHRHHRHRG